MTAHGAGVFGDSGLLGGDHVHDHAALQHVGEAALDQVGARAGRVVHKCHAPSLAAELV